jgi:Mg2+-importing ATPase
MELLCTDKTGTLTQDRVALARHADPEGRPSEWVLHRAFLNSHFQTGLKNLLDRAVLAHVPADLAHTLLACWQAVDELPFDFQRRRMSVRVLQTSGLGAGRHWLICKGAVDEVLAACTQVADAPAPEAASLLGDGAEPSTQLLDSARRAAVQQRIDRLQREGLRVVLVAGRVLAADSPRCTVADEAGLTLWGWMAFFDPPRESAAPALRALAAHGVAVKVLTGDNEHVTAQVAQLVGLTGADAPVLLGPQVQTMDDAQLLAAAQAHTLMARLTPQHKERIVRLLRGSGQVVGFLGDGINDAPALRAADVGISVNSAVDIAKEAADIILLEKSLLVLDEGVIEGRRTFANLLKYIRMTASSNFGNVLSVLVASAFLPFLPMRPLQLLVQNLLYDIGQTGIPFDHVDAALLARPLKWRPQDIGRFMRWFGPASTVFDLATFGFLWWGLGLQTVGQQGVFQSAWFMVGLLTQTLVVHLLRTPGRPFIDSHAAAPLTAMTLLIAAVGLALPASPLAPWFELQAVPLAFYAWLPLMLAGQATLTTVLKHHYIRLHGWH